MNIVFKFLDFKNRVSNALEIKNKELIENFQQFYYIIYFNSQLFYFYITSAQIINATINQ